MKITLPGALGRTAVVAAVVMTTMLLMPVQATAAVPLTNAFPIQGHDVSVCANSFGAPRSGGRTHQGDDCFAPAGTPLVAVESGRIDASGDDGGLGGIRIWLIGDSGTAYYYAHNRVNYVPAGVRVSRGQAIAEVGNTGNAASTPPHVHFEIHPGGRGSAAVDPYPYLAQWSIAKPIGNGSVVARNNGDGTYLEAILAGGHAFPLSQADKAELGLGPAQVIATETFNRLLNTPVSDGAVLAKVVASGCCLEGVAIGGKVYGLSSADKVALGYGRAVAIPARYFDGMASRRIANGTMIAKKTASGAWMEAITAGGQAFALSQSDKQWMGLGDATPIPERYFDGLISADIANGTVIAKRTDSGAWMEAITAGGKAFVLSSADKVDLGLGHASPIPARSFDALIGANVANGTLIAKKTSTGAWIEALVVGGKAYWISQADKTELNLGYATPIPARYYDGLASGMIDNGTVIAKKTASGAWMEAITAGGRAFVLSQEDKAWLGLGHATPIPARYFDALISTQIAERTVIARRNPDNTYLEAYIVDGRAIPLTQEDKIRLGLGRATLIPTGAFNSLL